MAQIFVTDTHLMFSWVAQHVMYLWSSSFCTFLGVAGVTLFAAAHILQQVRENWWVVECYCYPP